MPNTSTFGKRRRLKQRRLAIGVSQSALARALDVHRSTLFRWEERENQRVPEVFLKAWRDEIERLERDRKRKTEADL